MPQTEDVSEETNQHYQRIRCLHCRETFNVQVNAGAKILGPAAVLKDLHRSLGTPMTAKQFLQLKQGEVVRVVDATEWPDMLGVELTIGFVCEIKGRVAGISMPYKDSIY